MSELKERIEALNKQIERTSTFANTYNNIVSRLQEYVKYMEAQHNSFMGFMSTNPDERLEKYNEAISKALDSMKTILEPKNT